MPAEDRPKMPSILETRDTFIAAVPWGTARQVLVYRREHGGRTYIRLRTWNRHRKLNIWYPTKRYFVIPEADADDLIDAIGNAAWDEPGEKPDWLVEREQVEESVLIGLVGSEIPDDPTERSKMLAKLRRERQ